MVYQITERLREAQMEEVNSGRRRDLSSSTELTIAPPDKHRQDQIDEQHHIAPAQNCGQTNETVLSPLALCQP